MNPAAPARLCRWLAALLLAAFAQDAQAERLQLNAPDSLRIAKARLAPFVDDDFADILMLVGLDTFGPPMRVFLAPEGSELARRAPSWVSGYARAELAEIVLFPARAPSYPDRTLGVLLRHEVAHVLTFRATAGRPIPTWLAEGIATVAAREWGIEDRARWAAAVIGPGPRSLAELDAAFLSGGRQVARAYALSAALTRSLQRRHGQHTVAALLAGMARGEDLPTAFRAATGTSLAAFERRFFRTDAFWTTWVPFLTSTGALWMGITLLALYAIRRRHQRDAEQRARWQELELQNQRLSHMTTDEPLTDDPSRYN